MIGSWHIQSYVLDWTNPVSSPTFAVNKLSDLLIFRVPKLPCFYAFATQPTGNWRHYVLDLYVSLCVRLYFINSYVHAQWKIGFSDWLAVNF